MTLHLDVNNNTIKVQKCLPLIKKPKKKQFCKNIFDAVLKIASTVTWGIKILIGFIFILFMTFSIHYTWERKLNVSPDENVKAGLLHSFKVKEINLFGKDDQNASLTQNPKKHREHIVTEMQGYNNAGELALNAIFEIESLAAKNCNGRCENKNHTWQPILSASGNISTPRTEVAIEHDELPLQVEDEIAVTSFAVPGPLVSLFVPLSAIVIPISMLITAWRCIKLQRRHQSLAHPVQFI